MLRAGKKYNRISKIFQDAVVIIQGKRSPALELYRSDGLVFEFDYFFIKFVVSNPRSLFEEVDNIPISV